MKIRDIQTTGVRVPAPASDTALGHIAWYDYVLVEVITDEGLVGVGEISTLWDGGGSAQRAIVNGAFKEALIGRDPRRINDCLSRISTLIGGFNPAQASIEMALFDILGKSLDVPVYSLLGGAVRDRVALSRSIFYMEALDDMVATALEYVRQGYTCLKIKVGRPALRDDVRVVAGIREAVGPDVQLRLDANMGWRTAKEAVRAIQALAPYNLHSIEQPIPRQPVAQLRAVRNAVSVPVMADESVWGPDEAYAILSANAADYLNVYVAESGGLTNASLIFRMADLVGVPCVVGAMPELGVGTAAAVHLAFAMPNLGAPCDAAGVDYQEVDIAEPWLDIRDGSVMLPQGPGLGVTVDREALSRFSTDG